VLELGGFARLVHQHDTTRGIVLRAEFTTPGGLERFGRDLTDSPFPEPLLLERAVQRPRLAMSTGLACQICSA
jgi:hypothetical protein